MDPRRLDRDDLLVLGSVVSNAFAQPYMQRAGIIVCILAVMGAVVGMHVMLRRLAFLTEALQHTVFPGIAGAFVAGRSLLLGAAIAALLTVVLLSVWQQRRHIDNDSLLALLVTVFLGAGVGIVSSRGGFQHDLTVLLFGRILATDATQVIETACLAVVVIVVTSLIHKELVYSAFDPMGARAQGYPVRMLGLMLNVCVAIAVVASVRVLGTVLVLAFVVTPVVTARLVSSRIWLIIGLAALFAAVGGVAGLALSNQLSVENNVDIPAGAFVVVCISVLFCVVRIAVAFRRNINMGNSRT